MSPLLRLFCVSLFLCSAAAMTSPAARADDKPKHIQVVQTFEPARDNGTPLVQVRFSNTVIGTFAIDTGEYESVLTDTFAKRLAFPPAAYQSVWTGYSFFPITTVQIPNIKMEGLTVLKQTFHVVPQDFLFLFNGRPIDGILGGDLLSQFALRIDYPAHEIGWIKPGNLSKEDAAELGFAPQNLIILGQERDPRYGDKINHYTLRADFRNGSNTSSEDLMVDTGSPNTLISNALAEALALRPLKTEIIGTLSEPPAAASLSTAAQVQLGQMMFSDISVVSPQRKGSGFPSLLGENVLSNCVALLDFGPHRFYLRPVLPPIKSDAALPVDRKLIAWDRLRAAPDLPNVEEMLAAGLAPEAQNNLAEQVARLKAPVSGNAKNVERLEKLGAVLREGQDEAGAKAALTEAVKEAESEAKQRLDDEAPAGQWVEALTQAGRYEEAETVAAQTTVHLPNAASGWRRLGSVLLSHAADVLTGGRESITEKKALKIQQQAQNTFLDAAQAALIQTLLVQAHAAFNKAIALAPSDPDGYRKRGGFYLISLCATQAIQQAKLKVDAPLLEMPSGETALAEALADWQQCVALSPDNADQLATSAYLAQRLPIFHDRAWLTAHLKGTHCVLPAALATTDTVQSRLTVLTQSTNKTLAASAWTMLGVVQAQNAPTALGAETSWRQALALDPTHADALALLASHLKQSSQWTELRDLLTHQCLMSDTVPVRLTLATILNDEGLPADAETQVRAALALAPGNAAANLMLADLLLARSSGAPAALSEASICLGKARSGYGSLATASEKATLTTSQAVWLALDHDPLAAEKQLVDLAKEQPNCTQVREALAALIPYE